MATAAAAIAAAAHSRLLALLVVVPVFVVPHQVQVRVEIVKLNKGDEPVPDIEDVPLDVNAAVRATQGNQRSEAT